MSASTGSAGNGAASNRAQWGSRLGFILAASGSAVGLGNVWRFPYVTGDNGGGYFILIYLVCIALVGIPILAAEIMIGRAAQKQPVGAFAAIEGRRTLWGGVGWMGVLAGFVILSFYIVVAGWSMDYTLKSVVGFTNGIHANASIEAAQYRGQTPIDEMRSMLAERRVGDTSRAETSAMRRSLAPQAWRDLDRLRSAIEGAEDPESARARLVTDPVVRANVEAAEAKEAAIEEVLITHRAVATDAIAALSMEEVLERAEDTKRRDVIAAGVGAAFVATASDGWTSAFWSLLFMLITILIVAGGVAEGIERACRVLLPALLVLILVMVVYGFFQPGFAAAADFVLRPDATRLLPSSVLEALGQAFFTLSLGMGAMITYGSYQRAEARRAGPGLVGESIAIAGIDTGIALLACLMIFPIIFSFGQAPAAGPGLVFISMPLAFSEIGSGGMLLAILFFGLLFFAALTSSISLLEVIVSYFIDERDWSRTKATWILGVVVLAFGLPSAFAMDPGFIMSGWEPSYGSNFLDVMDHLASNWMLPAGGLLIAIYAGWFMPKRVRDAQLDGLGAPLLLGWLLLIRFVAPALVIAVLLQKVGIINIDNLLIGRGG